MKILGAHWLVILARSEHQASKRPCLQKSKARTNQRSQDGWLLRHDTQGWLPYTCTHVHKYLPHTHTHADTIHTHTHTHITHTYIHNDIKDIKEVE